MRVRWFVALCVVSAFGGDAGSQGLSDPQLKNFGKLLAAGRVMTGTQKMIQGDYSGAESDFSTAIQMVPGDAEAYCLRGEARMHLHKLSQALKDFDKAVSLDPKKPEYYGMRAGARYDSGDWRGAIADLDQVIRRGKGAVTNAYVGRARIFMEIGDIARAQEDAMKVARRAPEDSDAWRLRGLVDLRRRHLGDARREFHAALMREGPKPSVYTRAMLSMTESSLGDLKAATADADVAIRSSPHHHAFGLLARAMLEELQDKWDKARRDCADAASEDFDDAGPSAALGELLYGLGEFATARTYLEKAIFLRGTPQPTVEWFLYFCSVREGKQDAEARLNEFRKKLDAIGKDHWARELTRYLSRDSSKQKGAFRFAKGLDKDLAVGHECQSAFYRAQVHLRDGDKKGALALLDECIATQARDLVECRIASLQKERLSTK